MKFHVALILSILCMFLSSCAPEMPVEDQMQKVLNKGIDKYDVNGVSATVIFPDGKVWNGVSGISHATVPIAPNMLFATGSVTKNFIAALTLTLVEDEVLSLDDPLSMWLPKYPYVEDRITIRQLLNHTSGLYNFWDNDEIWIELKNDRAKVWAPEEVLEYIKEPYFEVGEGWRYSNTNYLLLAMIIKEASGSNLSTEFNTRLYQPLGLSDFYLSQEETIPAPQAHVYSDNFEAGEPIRDVTFLPRTSHESITYGSSGIFTTSENLARWAHALFGGRILKDQSLREMLNFIAFDPVSNMSAYGLGVQEFRKNISAGQRAIGHAGGNIGTTTYMVYLPELQVSVVVMINAFPNEGAQYIVNGLIKVILKDLDAYSIFLWIKANSPFSIIALCSAAIWIIGISHKIWSKRKL